MANRNQEIATPLIFVNSVENYFKISFKYDMAANAQNSKCPIYYSIKDDSLKIDWPLDGWCWLNPPFRNLTEWIRKCKEQSDRGCKIMNIWPLSGDKNQVPTWTDADVYIIHGRIWPHVRGIMLCRWKKSKFRVISGLAWNGEKLTKKWALRAKPSGEFGRFSVFKKIARLAGRLATLALAWSWAWTGPKPPTHFKPF